MTEVKKQRVIIKGLVQALEPFLDRDLIKFGAASRCRNDEYRCHVTRAMAAIDVAGGFLEPREEDV